MRHHHGTPLTGQWLRPSRRSTAAGAIVLLALSLTACDELSSASSRPPASDVAETSPVPDPEEQPTSTVVTSTVEAPTPTAPGTIDPQLVEEILQATWTSLENPHAELDMTALLTDVALEDIDNQRQEWSISRFHQVGQARIVSTEIDPTEDPDVIIARVCIDSSGVEVRDENDVAVNEATRDSEQRSLMLVTFELEDGVWKMAEQRLPDDPRC